MLLFVLVSSSILVNGQRGLPHTFLRRGEVREIWPNAGVLQQAAQMNDSAAMHSASEKHVDPFCVFALVRGGLPYDAFTAFDQSRQCLREAMPPGIPYEVIAFHDGDVPRDVQQRLSSEM